VKVRLTVLVDRPKVPKLKAHRVVSLFCRQRATQHITCEQWHAGASGMHGTVSLLLSNSSKTTWRAAAAEATATGLKRIFFTKSQHSKVRVEYPFGCEGPGLSHCGPNPLPETFRPLPYRSQMYLTASTTEATEATIPDFGLRRRATKLGRFLVLGQRSQYQTDWRPSSIRLSFVDQDPSRCHSPHASRGPTHD
jgi:hypothetical protein